MNDAPKNEGCTKCGGIILADTEDWLRPLCVECWIAIGSPEVEPKSEARNYRQWYLRDNFYARNVLHPVGDIFGTQLDVHAIEIKAYTDLLAKHERVLQALQIAAKRSTYEWSQGPDYFPSDYANEGRIALANEVLKELK